MPKLRENSIRFKIGIQLESIFVPSELIQCKNWISIRA